MNSQPLLPLLPLLFSEAIDYAGLFPPAALPMSTTVANHHRYRQSPDRDWLGRLVVQYFQLSELLDSVRQLDKLAPPLNSTRSESIANTDFVRECWPISVLVPSADESGDTQSLSEAVKGVEEFNQDQPQSEPVTGKDNSIQLVVDSLELKVGSALQIDAVCEALLISQKKRLNIFLEVDCFAPPEILLHRIADWRARENGSRLFAKIRTGSVVAREIPSPAIVARFVAQCAALQLPFKATAGLHHPIRGEYRLTYQPDSPVGMMHGFVNMFVATWLAFAQKIDQTRIEQVLSESAAKAFQFDGNGIGWQDCFLRWSDLDGLRRASLQSFGSCSFTEPIEEFAKQFSIEAVHGIKSKESFSRFPE